MSKVIEQPRAAAAADEPAAVQGGGHRPRALPGDRGPAPPRPGLRGHRAQAPGRRRARDVHRAQAVVRRRRRADVPGALAEDRAHRGDRDRRRQPREALLPARQGRQAGARARERGSRCRSRAADEPARCRRRARGRRGARRRGRGGRRGRETPAEEPAAEEPEAEAPSPPRPTPSRVVGRAEPSPEPPRSDESVTCRAPAERGAILAPWPPHRTQAPAVRPQARRALRGRRRRGRARAARRAAARGGRTARLREAARPQGSPARLPERLEAVQRVGARGALPRRDRLRGAGGRARRSARRRSTARGSTARISPACARCWPS